MWVFGLLTIGGLAVFLSLYQGSPGPLAEPHAKAIPGNFIWSCNQCHADEGLEAGCLGCHAEIARQYEQDTGYHAFLKRDAAFGCEQCHPDHQGSDFPLVSKVSWQGTERDDFKHAHVDFKLEGKHDELTCEKCHVEKRSAPFALPDFPDHHRPVSMLGLEQDCISCHEDVHKSGEKTRNCTQCHNQDAFKPAPFFDHSKYFVLEGPHARAACASCHQQSVDAPPGKFGPVKGKACADCHETPHRFETSLQGDCLSCHLAVDGQWSMGRRGVDAEVHIQFGFMLEGAHASVACSKCHDPEKEYAERYPNPASADYARHENQCIGCHADPHKGQFGSERYPTCASCHTVDRFMPSTLGPSEHPRSYPLLGGHRAVACNQCHQIDPQTEMRQFSDTPTACKACHADPHGGQFDSRVEQNDCTACHLKDFSSFRVPTYNHQNARAFFLGKGHAQAACAKCHAGPVDDAGVLRFDYTPTDCASCHRDVHRGQFARNGEVRCERCHASSERWSAEVFSHDEDARFSLAGAHAKVECKACHFPIPQPDGKAVVQYRPLTTRCEDCHGFQKN